MNAPKFKVGDQLVVTGEGYWSHGFKIGDQVEVRRVLTGRSDEPQPYSVRGFAAKFGYEVDQQLPEFQLDYEEPAPTEDEVAEALDSIQRAIRTEEVR